MNSINQRIANATKWSSLAEVAAKIVLPIVNMILARLLTPEAFGIVATINIVITFAEVFQDAGFQKYIIQHDFDDENDFVQCSNVAFWTNLSISVFVFFVIVVFSKQVAVLVGDVSLNKEIVVASFSIPIFSLSSMQTAQYKRAMDFKRLFWVRLITSFIPLFVSVPLAFILRSHWALIIGTLVRNIILVFALSYKAFWRPSFYYSFLKLKKMFSFCIWTLFEAITIWLAGNINVFIVTKSLGVETVGLFKNSIATSTSILGIVSAATTSVLFTSLSRCQNETDEFNSVFYNYQKLVSLLIIPMGVGMYLYRDLVTLVLLGNKWMECADFIGLYSIALSVTIVTSYFFSELYRAKGRPKVSTIAQLCYIALLVPATYYSVQKGFNALCIATVLLLGAFIIVHFVLIVILFRDIKIHIMIFNVFQVVIPATIMAGCSFALKIISDRLIWQIASIFICIIVYFSLVIAIKPLRETVSRNPITEEAYLRIKNRFSFKKRIK